MSSGTDCCREEPVVAKGVQSLLVVPLVLDGKVIGVITLGEDETHGFEEMDLGFFPRRAGQPVAIAIRNARLVEERERRILAEERNRGWPGVRRRAGQSVAGVLMKRRTAVRLFDTQPQQVKQWLEECRAKLWERLKVESAIDHRVRPSPAVSKAGSIAALEKRVSVY